MRTHTFVHYDQKAKHKFTSRMSKHYSLYPVLPQTVTMSSLALSCWIRKCVLVLHHGKGLLQCIDISPGCMCEDICSHILTKNSDLSKFIHHKKNCYPFVFKTGDLLRICPHQRPVDDMFRSKDLLGTSSGLETCWGRLQNYRPDGTTSKLETCWGHLQVYRLIWDIFTTINHSGTSSGLANLLATSSELETY